MPPQAIAALVTVLSAAQDGGRIDLRLDRGTAELVWITPSTFHFRRTLVGELPPWAAPETAQPPAIEMATRSDAVMIRSKLLEVAIRKSGVLLRVSRLDGTPLMADVSEAQAETGGIVWDREAPPGARFYGLGAREDAVFDLRGKLRRTASPFLLSTAGYGEYHPYDSICRFDFTASASYRIHAPGIDYFFYYGPAPRLILEEHHAVAGAPVSWPVSTERLGTWDTLHASLERLVHGAMSADLQPAFDLRPYANAPPELLQRARQVGSLVPDLTGEKSGFRKQLASFFAAYAAERDDKGYPVWHPLPFQFPDDPESPNHTDEFLLGDEMLVAPIYTSAGKRRVYLPQGIWTRLDTNEIFAGRQSIDVSTPTLPVFARNGAIIPLDSAGGIALHYFPKLAAEFFLTETGPDAWTAIHAAPAGDLIRLEIDSKKGRDYQWVVHHVERPSEVSFENAKYREAESAASMDDRSWFYDKAQKNLQVRVRVRADEDCVVSISF